MFPVDRWAEYIRGGIVFLVVMWAVFGVWRKMRSEYESEKILGMSLRLTVGFAVGALAGARLVWGHWGWWWEGGAATATGMWWWLCRRREWDFWEWADAIGPWVLAAGTGISLTDAGQRWPNAIIFGIGWVISQWVKSKYRTFRWYKSGKPGLVGLFCWMWGWLGGLVVAFPTEGNIYWVGLKPEQWLAAWLTAAGAGAVYARAGREFGIRTGIWLRRIRK
ncbi:MAG: hypothetical protein UX91_C0004G0034 [Candidatus Amesbacteria bacterium GW2011_GWB1_47_19]|nr:MAG: hypothetical protein UW51_C0005G0034 [Candidatus Amesbacteria bacterium GW2011_GWA1_44_24]KKU31591.1 MAG: hypothetical protein UX46_C0004G0034 [Candidatus Amesbacteria bacterium GW2011_GWC1_46_24]KKU67364.1 MAG: hypothetical protein UX91_C0004G0034 [Candidatus Amesbacteria bacterium GW2011_GWB1_47_19]OGD05221.1 MAG: hypothetical protein A2379_04410 [Candidatus Amesbacteria bacterium RIFOXYB1_FULL_47_13]HBC72586.1 hypothetical protein [Candidatus Amesbacteria bacterium]